MPTTTAAGSVSATPSATNAGALATSVSATKSGPSAYAQHARTPMSVSGAQFHEAMNAVNSPTMTFGDARALLRALGIEVK